MHIFCLDYTVSASKSYPLRVQNKLTTSEELLGQEAQQGSVDHEEEADFHGIAEEILDEAAQEDG